MTSLRRAWLPLLAALLAGLWGAFLALPHWRGDITLVDRLEAPLADLRFLIQGARPAPDSVTVVVIDDATARQAGSYPLPRKVVADMVNSLAAMGPRVLALDLLLVDAGPPDADRALEEALARVPTVIAAAGLFDDAVQALGRGGGRDVERVPVAKNLLLPLPAFANRAAVGLVNVATDASGVPRHAPLLVESGGRVLASFALRTAGMAAGGEIGVGSSSVEIGGTAVQTDLGYALPLRFYGPRGSFMTIGARDVLNRSVDPAAIYDKVVLVGATVAGGGDVFPTPFDPVLPGVEVMATAVANLTVGGGLVRDARVRLIDSAVSVILPVLLVLLIAWQRSTLGFALIAGVAAAWIGVTIAAFLAGIWLSAALPIAAAAPPAIAFGALRLWTDRRRAERLSRESRTLRRFHPPSLAKRLRQDPDFLSRPVRQEAALVFIDLSGFTGLSESLGPDETREMIHAFHGLVDEEAERCHGFVGSFMGDGAMVVFGLPEPTAEDACHAVEACAALAARSRAWLATLPAPITSRLGFKIGAHCGPIVASRMGGQSHEHITAIGDTVNVASRLMEVAAAHGADVAVSEDLYRAAGEACAVFASGDMQETFEAEIRGRSGHLAVRLWRAKVAPEPTR